MSANPSLTRALDPLRLRYLDSPLPGWLRAGAEALRDLLPKLACCILDFGLFH